jgi:hypothetical protein
MAMYFMVRRPLFNSVVSYVSNTCTAVHIFTGAGYYCVVGHHGRLFLALDTWLGWAYQAKKMPHAATTPIATAFKIYISHRKMGSWLLNCLPTKASFFDFRFF